MLKDVKDVIGRCDRMLSACDVCRTRTNESNRNNKHTQEKTIETPTTTTAGGINGVRIGETFQSVYFDKCSPYVHFMKQSAPSPLSMHYNYTGRAVYTYTAVQHLTFSLLVHVRCVSPLFFAR